jgi:hypothetical protein
MSQISKGKDCGPFLSTWNLLVYQRYEVGNKTLTHPEGSFHSLPLTGDVFRTIYRA